MAELGITKDYEKKKIETIWITLFLCPIINLDSERLMLFPRLVPELSELKAVVITTEETDEGPVGSLGHIIISV